MPRMRVSRAAAGVTAFRVITLLTALATLGASAVGCSSSSSGGAQPAACTPTAPTPTDAFARAHAPDSPDIALARAIADRWLAVHRPEDATSQWDARRQGNMRDLGEVIVTHSEAPVDAGAADRDVSEDLGHALRVFTVSGNEFPVAFPDAASLAHEDIGPECQPAQALL